MSRIGNKPITVPEGIEVKIDGQKITVKGPKGTLEREIHSNISVKLENGIITDIRQDGHGCSICCSSASVMSETLKGKTLDEAKRIINSFYQMIQSNPITEEEEESLGEAIAYIGVSQFPARIKCATLSWKATEKAISEEENK